MTVPDLVSDCHGKPVVVLGRTTKHYRCTGCGASCDARPADPAARGGGISPVVQSEHSEQSVSESPPARQRPLSPALLDLACRMPERGKGGLDEKVREALADLPRVRGYHTWLSVKSQQGFPDWVFCGPQGVLYRELKREGKDPTPKQQEWLDALTAAGEDAGVWRPSDWYSQRVGLELAALAGLRVTAESGGGR